MQGRSKEDLIAMVKLEAHAKIKEMVDLINLLHDWPPEKIDMEWLEGMYMEIGGYSAD